METRSTLLGAAGAVVVLGALGGAYYLGHASQQPPAPAPEVAAAPAAPASAPADTPSATQAPAAAPWPGASPVRHRARRVDLGYFRDQLSPYGRWQYDNRWGDVWQPASVDRDFHPYTDGHWAYTDEFGWTWVSNERWGDVVFHYGRWVDDPDRGWLWVPGYVWGPGWVVWRTGAGHAGWMPMPPDDSFLRRDESFRSDWSAAARDDYGYRGWYGDRFRSSSLWVYVDLGHLADPDYRRYAVTRPDDVRRLQAQTSDVTRMTTAGNYVVDRSLDPQRLAQASGHPVHPVAASNVTRRPDLVAPVTLGRQIAAQTRQAAAPDASRPLVSPAMGTGHPVEPRPHAGPNDATAASRPQAEPPSKETGKAMASVPVRPPARVSAPQAVPPHHHPAAEASVGDHHAQPDQRVPRPVAPENPPPHAEAKSHGEAMPPVMGHAEARPSAEVKSHPEARPAVEAKPSVENAHNGQAAAKPPAHDPKKDHPPPRRAPELPDASHP
jgi:hypothetical protein